MKKILLVRADRMGDVVLTTPVFKAIKEQLPEAHLALLVAKENEDLVRNHPFLDEVIAYDKKGFEGNNLFGFLTFAWKLRGKKFDVAVHFHPRGRFYWLSYFAGIPNRIGYRYKNHRLLTQTHDYDKPRGEKHEAEYNFDLLKLINVKPPVEIESIISCLPEFEQIPKQFLEQPKPYAVFNPSASSESKMWPAEFFAAVADELYQKYRWVPVIIGGPQDGAVSQRMERCMKQRAINLTGKLPLGALPWLFKPAKLFLSNDTGPVHVASAVGANTLSIFLRNLPGLGVSRWRPIGKNSHYLLEEVIKTCEQSRNGQITASDIRELTPSLVLKEIESRYV